MTSLIDTKTNRLPSAPSQVINREKVVTFTFDGKEYTAYEGDTIASALAAAGVTTFSRSFKYHRRRGLLCCAGNCPNCLVQVGDEPDVRSCVKPVEAGMKVNAQNAFPSLDADMMSATQLVDRFLPAGFYYKAFIRPAALWPLYEKVLRNAAGLGEVDTDAKAGYFDKIYKHADVTVVGGGMAGTQAALAAADAGARVILIESEPQLGGHQRYSSELAAGKPNYMYAAQLVDEIEKHPNIEVLTNTLAFGRYDHNWIGAVQGNRLIKLRTKSLVVATGAYETPPVFENNDLPGIMLGSAVRRLIHLYGVVPGSTAVVASANPRGLQTALEMIATGIKVSVVADMRAEPDAELVARLQAKGVIILPNTTVTKAESGLTRIESVHLRTLDGSQSREVSCDLLVLSTGFMPANELLLQAGAKMTWDETLNEFIPTSLPENVFAAGEVIGTHTSNLLLEGMVAGLQAANAAGFDSLHHQFEDLARDLAEQRTKRTAWTAEQLSAEAGKKDFVCFCEDVTRKDVKQSIDEGYDSMELLKRYSTVSMGPCQGKMCNMNALRVCAHYNEKTISETGTTTTRPPVKPVKLGALGGRLMEPVRVTPMHDWHVKRGAKMMNAGLWKRPEHYGDPVGEVKAVREGVGIIDISTLGKFHLRGKDVPTLLEKLYVNRWKKFGVGRVRYGVMLNNEGVVMDDGVTARLSEDFYYMTATSSGATGVYESIESWLQGGANLDVHVMDATELRAAMNLTGPLAREVLQKVCEGIDLSNEAFPYMHVREGKVAGVDALLLRVGFTGELGYEIHVPSGYGLHVWQALISAGKPHEITPFGVEAQRVMRLEKGHIIVGQDTDGLSNPIESGLAGLVKLDKEDFVGKTSLVFASEYGVEKRLVGFEMPDNTLPEEGNQIVRAGKGPIGLEIIGRITSVRRSPTLNKVVGLCWLPADMCDVGQEFSIRVRGELKRGRVAKLPFYDAEGVKLNS